MITVVQKPFDGPEGPLASGIIVDSSRWRNEGRLLNCRYLRAASESEATELEVADRTPPRPRAAPTTTRKRAAKGKRAAAR